jgi:hypothetical protein
VRQLSMPEPSSGHLLSLTKYCTGVTNLRFVFPLGYSFPLLSSNNMSLFGLFDPGPVIR